MLSNLMAMTGRLKTVLAVLAWSALLLGLLGLVSVAPAAAEAPWWHLDAGARPTVLPKEGEGTIVVYASNLSAQAIDGAVAPVTILDTLPSGLSAVSYQTVAGVLGVAGSVACSGVSVVSCRFEGELAAYEGIELRIKVKLEPGAVSGSVNRVSVTGGGAQSLSASEPLTIGGGATSFGVEDY